MTKPHDPDATTMPDPILSEEALAEIAERESKALAGPWGYKAGIFKHYVYSPTNKHFGFSMQEMSYLDGTDCPWTADTAAFIAAARTDVPALLASHRALAAKLAEAADLLQTVQDDDKANIPAIFRLKINDFLVKIGNPNVAHSSSTFEVVANLRAQLAAKDATIAKLERKIADQHLPTEERRNIRDWGN